MTPHHINNLENLIMGWYLKDDSICDELITFFETSDNKHPGVTGYADSYTVNKKYKDSTDVTTTIKEEIIQKYVREVLNPLLGLYLKEHKFVTESHGQISVFPQVNIQLYEPNQGYFVYHSERGPTTLENATRTLVFMTYLNTVHDAGETEFYYQKTKVKPEKGLTLIWPSDWTHTHRGITSPSEKKYIITGWINAFQPTRFGYPNWKKNIWV